MEAKWKRAQTKQVIESSWQTTHQQLQEQSREAKQTSRQGASANQEKHSRSSSSQLRSKEKSRHPLRSRWWTQWRQWQSIRNKRRLSLVVYRSYRARSRKGRLPRNGRLRWGRRSVGSSWSDGSSTGRRFGLKWHNWKRHNFTFTLNI